MITFLHWLAHITGCDYGLPYGHFGFYNLESGSLAVITGLSIFTGVRRVTVHFKRHQAALLEQNERHHAEKLAQAADHHEQMKAHITALTTGGTP